MCSEDVGDRNLRLLGVSVISTAVPSQQRELRRLAHPVFDDRAAGATVWPVDDEAVPPISPPQAIVVLPVDLEVPWLAVTVLEHGALDFDRCSVLKAGVVPTRSLENEPALASHSLLADRPEVVRSLGSIHLEPMRALVARLSFFLRWHPTRNRSGWAARRGPGGPRRP